MDVFVSRVLNQLHQYLYCKIELFSQGRDVFLAGLVMPIGRDRADKTSETRPIFRARKFCLVKKKKSLDPQVYSRIGKTMKKL